jgi:hypothetical protein
MDEAGEEAARLTIESAQALGFETQRLSWFAGKDITEALQQGYNIKEEVFGEGSTSH